DWFAKVITVIEELVQRIGNQQNINFRQAFYANSIRNTPGIYKDLINDIAIICRIHPTSLGIDPDKNREVFLGKDITLKVFRDENIFRIDPHRQRYTAVVSASSVPSRVYKVQVSDNIGAVLVVEHKNLATQLNMIEDGLNDVIIIKTQWFPTLSTREFIRTLWNQSSVDTKFTYKSDHDWQGANIFTLMKYG
ncbi:MAG: hypothetical protein L6R42_008386, partial [Xanthoria sp. 1 TBL-2021]